MMGSGERAMAHVVAVPHQVRDQTALDDRDLYDSHRVARFYSDMTSFVKNFHQRVFPLSRRRLQRDMLQQFRTN
jgi:hypothetical protein